ncbi:hypothetical protein [Haliea sp. E17]|uniref:hypothetical protein n=1 Tax=Haliea sp. E17 TaxID=3401576 RepID=UPI003AB038AB
MTGAACAAAESGKRHCIPGTPGTIPLFKDAIADLVNNHLVEVGGPFLAQLPIPALPISLPLDIDGDGTDDAEFDIELAPEVLDVLPGGDGQAVIAGSISSATVAPGREVLGSRRIAGSLQGCRKRRSTAPRTQWLADNGKHRCHRRGFR